MPWPIYIVEQVKLDQPREDPERPGVFFTVLYRVPGDAALVAWQKLKVGAIYMDHEWGMRIKLPGFSGCNAWNMQREGSPGNHWKVAGEMPNVTATPSINCVGSYHGWVTNGVVTDDCEGRKFDDYGSLIQ